MNKAALTASHQSQIEVSWILVRALADVVQQLGVSPLALLSDDAVDVLYSDPSQRRTTFGEYQALLAHAIELTGDPALGLHCGLLATESSFGLIGPLISHASTLRHAIQLMARFRSLMLDDVGIQLSEELNVAQLRFTSRHMRSSAAPTMTELVMAGLVRLLRSFGCAQSDIHAVCFEHDRPAHHHAYTRAFSGAERFAQSFTGVEFSVQALDRRHLHCQPELHQLLHGQAERSLQRLQRPLTLVERVRAIMNRAPIAQPVHLAAAAKELALSERSLRRRLQEEGTSFRALARSQLAESACTLLQDPKLPIKSIAHTLGFADVTAFHRAFKRWTNVTAAGYREQALRSTSAAPSHPLGVEAFATGPH